MRPKRFNALVFGCLLATCSCAGAMTSSDLILVGSTPGDTVIKSMLSIDAVKHVDFIRWHIVFNESRKTFVLNANYGIGKPNTPDFENGGERLALEGSYTVAKERNIDVYRLIGPRLPGPISIARLNDATYHVLSPDNRLMVGNGGWSYTLSQKNAAASRDTKLPVWNATESREKASEVVFDGRTPCTEIARDYNWAVGGECFKLKWKLTLERDPKTNEPTTYTLLRTLHRAEPISGKWTIIYGTKGATIYKLDPDKPDVSISFLAADGNVLFFLDKAGRLYGGNADVSYTLNRRNK